MNKDAQYGQVIERIFDSLFVGGRSAFEFEAKKMMSVANEMGIKLPRNADEALRCFRLGIALPASIRARAPAGKNWTLKKTGTGRFRFTAAKSVAILPHPLHAKRRIVDATPRIILKYALNNTQALLAKIRYNRLIELLTGVDCHPMQSNLRTEAPAFGQLGTVDLYVGAGRGVHFVFPVQAKNGRNRQGVQHLEQAVAYCAKKLPRLICRPIAAQLIDNDLIALMEFKETLDGLRKLEEKHYLLIPSEASTPDDPEYYTV